MADIEFYRVVEDSGYGEYRQKGSKFLAYAFRINTIDDVNSKLQGLKSEHPKANHHCIAYRLGFNENIEYSSDDREPSGSAGKPILGVLRSGEIFNTLIVVIRYFGGTQLGVPGLIHAYRESASVAIRNSKVIRKRVIIEYLLECDYDVLNELYRISQRTEGKISIISKDTSPVILRFEIPKSRKLELEQALENDFPLNKHCKMIKPDN
jgi:uncharacterized YigZ family protein